MFGEFEASLVFSVVARIQEDLIPRLLNPLDVDKLSKVIEEKSAEHDAYAIDMHANNLFLSLLNERGFQGNVFTEESGWSGSSFGDEGILICDPYDNTSITFRGFRESSVVVSHGSSTGEFRATAIADLQMYRIFSCIEKEQSSVWFKDSSGRWIERPCHVSNTRNLKKAHVAISLTKRKRRVKENPDFNLISRVGSLYSIDGAIMIARLAAGELDAYVDAYVGQPAYELPAIELVRKAGGVVTDHEGNDLSFQSIIESIREEPAARIRIVAAATRELHEQIMNCRLS